MYAVQYEIPEYDRLDFDFMGLVRFRQENGTKHPDLWHIRAAVISSRTQYCKIHTSKN